MVEVKERVVFEKLFGFEERMLMTSCNFVSRIITMKKEDSNYAMMTLVTQTLIQTQTAMMMMMMMTLMMMNIPRIGLMKMTISMVMVLLIILQTTRTILKSQIQVTHMTITTMKGMAMTLMGKMTTWTWFVKSWKLFAAPSMHAQLKKPLPCALLFYLATISHMKLSYTF